MKTPSLEPRRYKIDHDANEYTYFVSWQPGSDPTMPWVVEIPGGKGGNMYMTKNCGFDFDGPDTAYFGTADMAFAFWQRYIEIKHNVKF